ncbi:unnamed protein product [Vitrella brassicaformis CCMP3155]|uniref:DNA-(apurinic or apyrimidinic site) endonuclease n=1 Tax=Vitrella brassicaformis (strain CCMP3155) TaxID=1169540 RepID=A0A0G4GSG3_VITBC|nr:unnamed protein product [Vitrella brassicaformis CCMP3155]|eukprot:CEM33536.1 unnamed protein product [Vitrella brassicaformis CCMP3155]
MKRLPEAASAAAEKRVKRSDPLKIVTWNVNGLTTRIKDHKQWKDFESFMETEKPDVVCLQEIKLCAAAPPGAKKGDGRPRDRGQLRDNDASTREDADRVNRAFKSSPVLSSYSLFWSLADWRYAGCLMMARKDIHVRSVRYSLLLPDKLQSVHHEEGRVILAEFESFAVMNMYTPNNGWQTEKFSRRHRFDTDVQQFVKHFTTDSTSAGEASSSDAPPTSSGKPLIIAGDLNCAATDLDLSPGDERWFRQQTEGPARPPPKYVGQPGCTDGERADFREILKAGSLVDAYRQMHPRGAPSAESPCFSWRGWGKYANKGMRIDHILVSESLMGRVESVRITGKGTARGGMEGFMGSDHCPLVVQLRPTAGGGAAAVAAGGGGGGPSASGQSADAAGQECIDLTD